MRRQSILSQQTWNSFFDRCEDALGFDMGEGFSMNPSKGSSVLESSEDHVKVRASPWW